MLFKLCLNFPPFSGLARLFYFYFLFYYFYFCFFFGGGTPWHMEVPRLRAESDLWLLACATATATPDLSQVCDLHHSSWQCRILNPMSEARDRTLIFMFPSQIRFCCPKTGTPDSFIFLFCVSTKFFLCDCHETHIHPIFMTIYFCLITTEVQLHIKTLQFYSPHTFYS